MLINFSGLETEESRRCEVHRKRPGLEYLGCTCEVNKHLGQKLNIGYEHAAITAYMVRCGGDVRYEITYQEGVEVKTAWLSAFALSELVEGHAINQR